MSSSTRDFVGIKKEQELIIALDERRKLKFRFDSIAEATAAEKSGPINEVVEEGQRELVKTKTQMIINLYHDGLDIVDIAKALCIRYQHVTNTLLRKDLPLRYRRKLPDQNIRIVANTLAEIAEEEMKKEQEP
jgi:hypothetical protein